MIRTYQDKALGGKTYGSVTGFSSPDFDKVAAAYGLGYVRISSMDDYRNNAHTLTTREPFLYEVMIDPQSEIDPAPAYNRPVEDQYPLLDRKEYQEIMDSCS
jgi:acetolactate synthase I/II/III large subunit